MSDDLYADECKRAEGMDRDAILHDLDEIASRDNGVPALDSIHHLMIRVEALADAYRETAYDQTLLLEAVMRCHERFRDWIGAYS